MTNTCLTIIKQENLYKIRPYLNEHVNLIMKKGVREAIIELRTRNINCIIFYMNKESSHEKEKVFGMKEKFPTIPLISIFADRCLETAREFGEAGIDRVIHYSDILCLKKEVTKLIVEKSIRIALKDIGIVNRDFSKLLNKALQVLETNYVRFRSVKEIADILEISECTLSREFKKHNLPGPKRILMYLKVHHAYCLMKNSGLNKREIALLSGFSNERCLNDRIKKIFVTKIPSNRKGYYDLKEPPDN